MSIHGIATAEDGRAVVKALEAPPPQYLMNVATREVYAYCAEYLKNDDPKFVPYLGPLPPLDLATGTRIAKDEVALASGEEELTPEQRIERIAAVVHLVPREEISESGKPSAPAIEKLTGLENVRRAEVNAAIKLRAEAIDAKKRIAMNQKTSENDQPTQ